MVLFLILFLFSTFLLLLFAGTIFFVFLFWFFTFFNLLHLLHTFFNLLLPFFKLLLFLLLLEPLCLLLFYPLLLGSINYFWFGIATIFIYTKILVTGFVSAIGNRSRSFGFGWSNGYLLFFLKQVDSFFFLFSDGSWGHSRILFYNSCLFKKSNLLFKNMKSIWLITYLKMSNINSLTTS
jgi:hypothetical protein